MRTLFVFIFLLAVTAVVAILDWNAHIEPYHSQRSVLLNSGVIDTTATPTFSKAYSQPWIDYTDQFLVHYKASLTESVRLGLEVITQKPVLYYLPHNTFIAIANHSAAREIEQLDGVLWVGKLPEHAKLESRLIDNTMCQDDEGKRIGLYVRLAGGFYQLADAVDNVMRWSAASQVVLTSVDDTFFSVTGLCADIRNAARAFSRRPAVLWVERAPEYRTLNKFAHGTTQSGGAATQTPIWNKGITGVGQVAGCSDTGLDYTSCFFNDSSAQFQLDVVNMALRKVVYYETLVDGAAQIGDHGTHVVGSIVGSIENTSNPLNEYAGMAPGAKVAFQDVGDASGLDVPANLATGLFPSVYYNASVRVHSNSWGEDRNVYTSHSQQIDQFTFQHQDFVPLWAAGNSGSKGLFSLGAPATAKNCIAVAAEMSTRESWEQYEASTMVGVQRTAPASPEILNAVPAGFGPKLTTSGVSAPLSVFTPANGCSPSSASQTGNIVLIRRGDCFFMDKVKSAQDAGAIGVIVINNDNTPPIVMGSIPNPPTITIPSVMISLADGNITQSVWGNSGVVVIKAGLAQINLTGNALYSHQNIASFSSRGPTTDGRIKPDLAAPGQYVFSARSSGQVASEPSCAVLPFQGTSMATPVTAGSALLVRDYFMQGFYPSGAASGGDIISPSGSLVKAMLIQSTMDMSGVSQNSDGSLTSVAGRFVYQGYGRIQLDTALRFTDSNFNLFVVNGQNLTTGNSNAYCFNVPAGASAFKVTLVWHDYPATNDPMVMLVNDLNLLVMNDAGVTYVGNFAQRSNSQLYDTLNNVEQVIVPTSTVTTGGVFTVVVIGANIPQGPQPFSIVVTGQFNTTTCGAVSCPSACTGHGSCVNAMCVCDGGFSGIDCSTAIPQLPLNGSLTGQYLPVYGWLYYQWTVTADDIATMLDLGIQFNRTSGNGDPDLYIRVNGLPSFTQWDYAEVASDPGGTTIHLVTIPNAQLTVGTYYMGVFGYCCADSVFAIRALTGRSCAVACENGGLCDLSTGTCSCVAPYYGTTCTNSGISPAVAVGIAVAVLGFGLIIFVVLFCRHRIASTLCPRHHQFEELESVPLGSPVAVGVAVSTQQVYEARPLPGQ